MKHTNLHALLIVAAIASTGCNASRPRALLRFESRHAVVRTSTETSVLVGPGHVPVIVVGRDESGPRSSFENRQAARGATVFSDCLEKITGIRCGTWSEATPAPEPAIRIGADGNPAAQFPQLANADAHGFVIVRKGEDLHIVGASGTGTLYGVWFFLMNYADVRQVLPGELGMVYPRRERLEIPKDLYVLNPGPDFLLRIWSGNNGLDQEAWLADTNATQRFEYHHAAGKIYDPARFGQTHPQYFPVVGGKPAVPPGGMAGWQPTFSEPASVQRAIDHVGETIEKSPWLHSVSLTVNDGGGYSEKDYLAAQQIPGGAGRLSDVYFDYVNRVARGVGGRFPGKFVSCLAYMAVEAPPAFAMEDNVLVFAMNEPRQIIERWKDKSRHWGIYMWLYGNNWWLIPNHWPHSLQDSLRWMHNRGFVAFKGEIYGRWAHDAPKTWVLSNLLWNVDADVDALLKDYFEHAYGPEAAPAVARYFAQAEAIHARRQTPARYNFILDLPRGGYRPRERQFADVNADDVRLMAEALDDARRDVRGESNQKRLMHLESCFGLWRSFWEQYRTVAELQAAKVRCDADVQRVLTSASRFHAYRKERAIWFRERLEAHPQVCYAAKDPGAKLTVDRMEAELPWNMANHAVCLAMEAISSYQRSRKTPAAVAAQFWENVARTRPELAEAVRLQRVLSIYPDRPYRRAIGDGSIGAAVNTAIVAELAALQGAVDSSDIDRIRTGVLARLSASGALPDEKEAQPQAGRIAISQRSTAPVIDGRLDDAVWQQASVADGFFAAKKLEAARYRTEFRLLHDDTHLYVGVRAWQDTRGLRAAVRFRDMKVWEDDSIELMVCDPNAAQPGEGFHIIANALGVVFDQMDGAAEWNGSVRAAAAVDAEGYSVEFSVPLSEIGIDLARSRFMRVNFARGVYLPGKLDLRNPWDELSSWYPHQGDNLDPRFRGWLLFNP